jgi:hypothetical protein
LQSRLIDSRPRYALATTSRILKKLNVEEDDTLKFKSSHLQMHIPGTPRTENVMINHPIYSQMRIKSPQPKLKRNKDFVDFLFQE